MLKVHLDTDIGGDIDDLCALAYLLKHPNIEITGITTVAEQDGKRAGYVKRVLEIAGRTEIPFKAGSDVSLNRFRYRPGYPIEEDYWGTKVESVKSDLDDALELMRKSVENDAVIIGIGPYTNLYYLDKKFPGILRKANLYLMGGYIFPPEKGYPDLGNENDYNIQLDVEAAKYVLLTLSPTMIPLSVCLGTHLTMSDVDSLEKAHDLGKLIAKQARAFAQNWENRDKYREYENIPSDFINFQYDPLACAVATNSFKEFRVETFPLDCEVKNTYLVERVSENGKPTKIVVSVDGKAFNKHWLEIVTTN